MANGSLQAPFPYFGGKSRIAPLVWQRFGAVRNYIEPFAGSLAVLLQRPEPILGVETITDADGLLCNFWRALAAVPDEVARWADWPVNELDLSARQLWLLGQKDGLTARLGGDPDYYDAKAAGWWVWGISAWIGAGWCSGQGPWTAVDGVLTRTGDGRDGVKRVMPYLTRLGMGVHAKKSHLTNLGRGVHNAAARGSLQEWFTALAERLRYVRVCCGDWTRIMGPTPLEAGAPCAVFLDPPYSQDERDAGVYGHDQVDLSVAVRDWAIAHGDDPNLRVALCGYEGEHDMPAGWQQVAWRTSGGYGKLGHGRGRSNALRERIWFSRHCLSPAVQQLAMFDTSGADEYGGKDDDRPHSLGGRQSGC